MNDNDYESICNRKLKDAEAQALAREKPSLDPISVGRELLAQAERMVGEMESKRGEPGRFLLEGKVAVFYSGPGEWLTEPNKDGSRSLEGKRLHSSDLASRHVEHDSGRSIAIWQTKGGRELQRVEEMVDTLEALREDVSGLRERVSALWRDASSRFAADASHQTCSLGYVQYRPETGVYSTVERPRLLENSNHVHLTDSLPRSGRPAPEDIVPERMLDDRKRFFTA